MGVADSGRESRDVTKGGLATSDKPSYVAHSLALLNEMRTWCVVRERHCSKKRRYFTIHSMCGGNAIFHYQFLDREIYLFSHLFPPKISVLMGFS
jgi:hypothetical protein